NYATNGGQYPIAGVLPGEQVHPQVSLNGSGGYLVWEDNITDGYGLGVSALKVDSTLSGVYAPFRVNSIGEEDQERPVVSLLKQGGAAFVWQGGKLGFQHVYARFLAADGTWVGEDILVNSAADRSQLSPAVATLANGNVVVVYGSMNQVSSNSLQDVFGQILTPAGQKVGGELLINQFTTYNQRSASVAALSSGGFVVAWISEQERSGAVDAASADYLYGPTNQPSVDVFARAFGADGTPATGEILVNSAYEICANPAVAAGTDGGFMVTWQQRTLAIPVVGYDILARPFSSAGVGGIVVPVNTYLYGDQYDPRIAALGTDYFVVWTSLAQDGAREGVFGRFLRSTGEHIGAEVLVNTTTVGQQMHPCVAADGRGRFLTVWTSFVGGIGSFDLFAQRWVDVAQPLQPMDPPYVYAPFRLAQVGTIEVYQPELQVSWPILAGLAVDHYEVYVNGASSPAASLTTNIWLMTAADGLTVSSTNSFRVAYVAADGRRSPLSAATTRATWSGYNWGGIPFEWMSQYYGGLNIYSWPSPNAPVAQGGPTLLQVFLTGANPLDSATWLRTAVVQTPEGYFLTWNPQPGLLYQVQTSPDLTRWADQGGSRFAAGSSDSVYIGGNNTAYYRVLRLR
ncbi:MAG TPA: hypothetical protein VJA21_30525, partial [Verrucomicrobiae bacterium]